MSGGVFTVSLDFELHWGSRDHRSLAEHRPAILGGREAVPKILELFARYGIHATWAAVGFTFFETREQLLGALPARRPAYLEARYDPYRELAELGPDERADPCHFAGSLLRRIAAVPGQELGTHTFSHYYCLEPGPSLQDFRSDLQAAREASRRTLGVELGSLVFPRNQYDGAHVAASGELGITAYRGNPRSWVYDPRGRGEESLLRRAARLADSYVNLTGHHGHRLRPAGAAPVNVPASRFLRPWSRRLRALEGLRLRRIREDLSHCARADLMYHLWWHPENFGTEPARNLEFLERVLEHFASLRERNGMRSLNMSEAAAARPPT